ncbi:MAG TPA: DoxX family protein, partial [Geopsychrobacteraceae bacterium]
MLHRLFETEDSYSGLVLRLSLALVIFPHGAQKLFGWFGGNGFAGTLQYFTDTMGIPFFLAFLVILAESFGALGLALGLLTRVCAIGIGSVMIGAVLMVHWPNGFFMNWSGNQPGEGFEFHLLAIGIALALVLHGG